MKKLFPILFLYFFVSNVFPQILISPYIVYIDEKNKNGNFIVQNESENIYEVSVKFLFGYPISDSIGQITMKYIENDSTHSYSINNFIRAFPKKFILEPKKRQIIRLTIKAPDTLESGTYWTRIITSAVPFSDQSDTLSSGITAKIKFVLNQVTTCMYRVNPAESGLKIENYELNYDSTSTTLVLNLKRIGNSPFIGNLLIKILDEKGNIVKDLIDYVPVYFELQKRFVFNYTDFEPNKSYIIHITASNIEKEEIPESTLKVVVLPELKIPIEIPFN